MPQRLIDALSSTLNALPEGVKHTQQEIEQQTKWFVDSTIKKLNLVTREEFEWQQNILLKTREEVTALTQELATLKAQLNDLLIAQKGQHPCD